MGHCNKFNYALWASVENVVNLVMRIAPPQEIWLCAMGHRSKFGQAL
jgi:hypothetical protein